MPKFEIADAFWESDLWEFFVEWAVRQTVIDERADWLVRRCECTLGIVTSMANSKYNREQIGKMSYAPHSFEKDFYEWKVNVWEKSPPF